MCFLVEFDLLFAFGVLSCRILDSASLFISYVHEHDRLYLIAFDDFNTCRDREGQFYASIIVWNRWPWKSLRARSIMVSLNHGTEM